MRFSILLLLLLLTSSCYSQIFMIDRGSEEWEKLNTGRSTIAWIEMNKPSEIMKYLSKEPQIDKSSLVSNCKDVSSNFPFDDSLPGFFASDEKNSLWYERTYYQKSGDEIDYLLQIYIDLVWEDGQSRILNIQFRRDNDIESRDKEMDELKRIGEIPPPPPPPPGLPIKH